jgi:hypothetical protein
MVAAAGIAAAQDDPPSRVASLSYMNGPVSYEPASVDQWTDATLNYPLTTGDNLYTDQGAAAVLRVGRNSIRLAQGTNFQFVNLSDNVVQMSINSGALSVRVRNLYEGESWEVDTPNGAVTLLREGEYRIDTDPDRNATMVTARNGDVEVTSNNQSFPVHAGQTAYLSVNGGPDIRDQNPLDDFDNFAISRDRLEDVPAPRYISPDIEGYEDLNAYGRWSTDPNYGPVWMPSVAAGWAPYQAGHWAWVDPWGWTWVDDAPWGFAPFHYGRWAYMGGGWGWVPGPVVARPVYAPALVAFVGGGGWGVSIGIGGGFGVGWFALGPREPYFPAYHVSNVYIQQVNITNIHVTGVNFVTMNRNVTYVNRSVAGAVMVVPQGAFASAQPVQRAAVRVTPDQIRQAPMMGMTAAIAPQRVSVLGTARVSVAAHPPANVVNRPVVARLAPPPPPVSFAARQQLLQQHPGQPLAPQQLQTIRQQQPAAAPARVPVRPVNAAQVRPITPTVRTGNAPAPAAAAPPRQYSPQGQPPPAQRAQPAPPPTRPQAAPAQQAPPVRQQAPPPSREQAAPPPARQQAAPAQPAPPPVRQQAAPPPREQAAPQAAPQRQPPPPKEKPKPAPKKEEEKKKEDK